MAPEQHDPEERAREEAERAAEEAGAIGGLRSPDEAAQDPAQAPLQEAGEGYAEGYEQAEDDLIENASHGTHNAEDAVLRDEMPPEEPSEASYGEPDHIEVSERDGST